MARERSRVRIHKCVFDISGCVSRRLNRVVLRVGRCLGPSVAVGYGNLGKISTIRHVFVANSRSDLYARSMKSTRSHADKRIVFRRAGVSLALVLAALFVPLARAQEESAGDGLHPVLEWLERRGADLSAFELGYVSLELSKQELPLISRGFISQWIREGASSTGARDAFSLIDRDGDAGMITETRIWAPDDSMFRVSKDYYEGSRKIGWDDAAKPGDGSAWGIGGEGDFYRLPKGAEHIDGFDIRRRSVLSVAKWSIFGLIPMVESWAGAEVERSGDFYRVDIVSSFQDIPMSVFVQEVDDGEFVLKAFVSRVEDPKPAQFLYFYAIEHAYDNTLGRWVIADAVTGSHRAGSQRLRLHGTSAESRERVRELTREPALVGDDALRGTLRSTKLVVYESHRVDTFEVREDGTSEFQESVALSGTPESAARGFNVARYLGWILIPLAIGAVVFVRVRK